MISPRRWSREDVGMGRSSSKGRRWHIGGVVVVVVGCQEAQNLAVLFQLHKSHFVDVVWII